MREALEFWASFVGLGLIVGIPIVIAAVQILRYRGAK